MPKKIKTKYKALIACGYQIDADTAYVIEETLPQFKDFIIYNSAFVSDNEANIIFGKVVKEVDNYLIMPLDLNDLRLNIKDVYCIIKAAKDTKLIKTTEIIDKEEFRINPEYYLIVKEEIGEWV